MLTISSSVDTCTFIKPKSAWQRTQPNVQRMPYCWHEVTLHPATTQRDAATSWAAYVAGCLLVAAAEADVSFSGRDVDILIQSAVPEGKGVSSSAAVEVATMTALLAAAAASVDGRQLALMCQRVENLVRGPALSRSCLGA